MASVYYNLLRAQGFASGSLAKDAAALRMFADAGIELLLAQSFAKNMVRTSFTQCCLHFAEPAASI